MFFDKTLMLSDGQTITADAAGTDGTSALTIAPAGDDYSRMWIAAIIKSDASFAGSTANPTGAEVEVKIQSCDVQDFSTGSPEVITHGSFKFGSSSNITSLKKGMAAYMRLPLGLKKYVRCYFDVTLTGGTSPAISTSINVGLTDGVYTPQ